MLNYKHSIVLINCYFGKFPWYFNLFIKSCEKNPSIDFLIFCDGSIPPHPQNVKFIKFSLEEFNNLSSEKLNIKIEIKTGYKLCDLKPSYGIIFEKYIRNYDFWGITDIDVIYGRIREFMTPDLLENHDIISARNDYPTGSFLLFRNNFYLNNLFTLSRDYKKVFSSPTHFCFDECNFKHNYLQMGHKLEDLECEIDSLHHVINREMKKGKLRPFFDMLIVEGLPGNLEWNEGKLSYKNEFEILYYHLIVYKSNILTRKPKPRNGLKYIYIDKYTIRTKSLNHYSGLLNFLYFNKIGPYLNQFFFKTDYNFSRFLNIKVRNLMPRSYLLHQKEIDLISNEDKSNSFYFRDSDATLPLSKSLFHKNSFYAFSAGKMIFSKNSQDESIYKTTVCGNMNKMKAVENFTSTKLI